MSVDCNHHSFYGSFEEKIVEGYGYTYYELSNVGEPSTTLMDCGNTPHKKEFVEVSGDYIYRYNSRLSFVVYVPNRFDVQYRILKPEEVFKAATKE